MWRLRKFH